MSQITKRQHIVPRAYLSQWCQQPAKVLHLYDLQEKTHTTPTPTDVLVVKRFYEVEELPANHAEKILSLVEGDAIPILKSLHATVQKWICNRRAINVIGELQTILKPEQLLTIKRFAAFQYLRVPGAITRKRNELEPSPVPQETRDCQLKPGNFVLSGFDYICDRFEHRLGLMVFFSFDDEFVTSDWPCFDMRDSDSAPLLGEEIGVSKDVVAMLPLTPRVLAVLFPFTALTGKLAPPKVVVQKMSPSAVRNTNTLVIQQAIRWIVANKQGKFVFKVAAKRKRALCEPPRKS